MQQIYNINVQRGRALVPGPRRRDDACFSHSGLSSSASREPPNTYLDRALRVQLSPSYDGMKPPG